MVKPATSRKKRTVLIIVGSLIVLLIALRIALPYILLRAVNHELSHIKGYSGHVDDLDVALYRGAYTLKTTKLDKVGGKIPVPFFAADVIDLSIEWGALLHGAIDGKIRVEHPVLTFVKGPTEETSQMKVDSSWTDVVKHLMPLNINRLEVNDGEVHYKDFHSDPKVDIFAKKLHILAENLSNAKHNKELMPSTAEASAEVYGGTARLHMKLNALSDIPVFVAKAELVSLDITNLNNFLQAYAKFDVKSGNISIYMEAATKNDVITGYIKPIIKDLKVVNWKEDKDQPLKIAWEAVIGSVAWVFKNHGKDQLATKVEFQGNLKSPNINIIEIIGQILYNAFIQALYPSLENSININSVGKSAAGQKAMGQAGGGQADGGKADGKADGDKKHKGFLGKIFHGKKEKKKEKKVMNIN